MTRYVALLRAVNVAGHGVVKMSVLHQAFVSAGFEDVKTVIQSGNVLFSSPCQDAALVSRTTGAAVGKLLGSNATVIVRYLVELEALADIAPFSPYESRTDVKCYVTFLSEKPRTYPPLPLTSEKEALEVLAISGREAFILSRKKKNARMFGFPNQFIESELGVSATTRNWSTIKRIIAQGMSRSATGD